MTAALCGPKTRVLGNGEAFSAPLNSFMFIVADPGAGKSTVYEKVMEPIQIENYTTAGVHKQQIENNGYGIITSDEGHRFLSSVDTKQGKGEGERAFLCKLWNGKGDFTSLASGTRGFKETSMSLFLMIQPQPFLSELSSMISGDGLLDRFLLFSTCPTMSSSATVRENFSILKESSMQSFIEVMMNIYNDHKDGVMYKLSPNAQEIFDKMSDNYAEYIKDKYSNEACDSEDKENVSPTQSEDSFMVGSKDTIHIIRISCILHILDHYMKKKLNPVIYQGEEFANAVISTEKLLAAKKLFHNIAQKKSIFLEAAKSVDGTEPLKLRKVVPFHTRVLKALCKQEGPIVSFRNLQRYIKGSLVDNVRVELEKSEQNGFGKILVVAEKNIRREMFMKPSPTTLSADNSYLTSVKISLEDYTSKFIDGKKHDISKHYQFDEICDMFQM